MTESSVVKHREEDSELLTVPKEQSEFLNMVWPIGTGPRLEVPTALKKVGVSEDKFGVWCYEKGFLRAYFKRKLMYLLSNESLICANVVSSARTNDRVSITKFFQILKEATDVLKVSDTIAPVAAEGPRNANYTQNNYYQMVTPAEELEEAQSIILNRMKSSMVVK